jgi:hypothetical protein
MLELAEACNGPVRWACRAGVCHNCESGLVSGAVICGPEPLDKPADGNILSLLPLVASVFTPLIDGQSRRNSDLAEMQLSDVGLN